MSSPQTILIVDTEEDFLGWAKKHLSAPGVSVVTATSAETGMNQFEKLQPDLSIIELRLQSVNGLELLRRMRLHDPNAMVVITTGFPSTSAVIESMKLGAYDVLRKESLNFELRPVVEAVLRAQEEIRVVRESKPKQQSAEDYRETIIGKSPAMQDVFKMIGRISRSDAPVLITGESGCGKEVVATAIHKFSLRSNQEYVAINCAAIPPDLLESELFGHEKGAFTGAQAQRVGRFEQCDGGALFLDEIGDMPLPVQSKILRVLQEGEFSRVGGNQTLRSDVRIIAATNKDLEKEVELKRFREDLFYRLNVVRIHIPPLRQRREDILLLVDFFLQRIADKRGAEKIRVTDEALQLLEAYDWPGNVRELENTIQRACVLANNNVLLPKDIPVGRVPRRVEAPSEETEPETIPETPEIQPAPPAPPSEITLDQAVEKLLDAAEADENLQLLPWLEREMTKFAMKRVGGNQVKAAKLLGITRGTLRKRLERHDIS
ncbi:MAG: DNA-binding NtrC family response regulator [Verrucomicrobiales bacterium]|jgi:DNA-binding NtrC family response regulator